MNHYHLNLQPYGAPVTIDLYHKDTFSELELHRMLNFMKREMRYAHIRDRYTDECGFLLTYFGFTEQARK